MRQHDVFLTQTDTTIGFVSQNAERLTQIKQRPPHKQYIKAVDSLRTLKQFARIPANYRNRLRRAKKSTFILPDGYAYRIIHDPKHRALIQRLGGWAYTTSANQSGKPYSQAWARAVTDKVIEPLEEKRNQPSAIYKINTHRIIKIR